MNAKAVVLAVLVVALFIVGCSQKNPTGNYAAYNQPQEQGQSVGGGCGVAPMESGEDTPVNDILESEEKF